MSLVLLLADREVLGLDRYLEETGPHLVDAGFPGATGAVLIGLSPILGLSIFTVLAGIGIGLLGEKAHRDVAIGLVLTLSLGLGLLFLHFYTAYASQATNVLFGNVLGISASTLVNGWTHAPAAIVIGPLVVSKTVYGSTRTDSWMNR